MALLLSLQRSGTAMFCEMLNSHPQISCQHELYADWTKRKDYKAAMEEIRGGKDVVVGHAQFNQLHTDMLTDGIKRILLTRESFMDGALGQLLMFGRRPEGQYSFPQEYLDSLCEERKLRTELMRPYADMVISYEEITGGKDVKELPQEISHKVCAFLGVPVAPMTTTRSKRYHRHG